jgi:lactoylglutathione lyase
MTHFSLIVLRCSDLELSRTFYTALGLTFHTERHGEGAVHYSCQLDDLVLELYPGKPGSAPEKTQAGSSMHGILVESLDEVLASLQKLGVEIVRPPSDSAWGRYALVLDPDGRVVQLTQGRR